MKSNGMPPDPCMLMTPDIVEIHPDVYRAMYAEETSPGGLEAVMEETTAMLKVLLQTSNGFSFTGSGVPRSGTELLAEKLLRHSETVLVPVYGGDGLRLAGRLERCGADVVTMEQQWGRIFDPDEIVKEMKKRRPALVSLVHGDLTTGKMQSLEEIGKACQELDILLLVDVGATSGCVPLRIDDWQVDAVAGGPGKCLCIPDMIEQISYNERVEARLAGRRWSIRSHEARKRADSQREMTRQGDGLESHRGLRALREGLSIALREGIESRFARQQLHAGALEAGLLAMGLRPFGAGEGNLPMMAVVLVPEGVSGDATKNRLWGRGIAIAGPPPGLDVDIWRLATIGPGANRQRVIKTIQEMELALLEEGFGLTEGLALAAAENFYEQH
ncbi:pyridoxal-phosphate-dependent aminotransferase family protein [Paenibacillus sp. CAU 1782]